MKTGSIRHPVREPLIKIHRWQVEICEGDVVAAALLSFFEYWHDIKLEMHVLAQRANDIAQMHGDQRTQDESLLQFHSEEELIEGIMIAKRDTIRRGIKLLESKRFISIHRNPNSRYAFDKTRYFLFHPEPINEWLANRPSPRLSKNQPSMSKNRQRSSKNQQPSSENQQPSSKNASAITEITSETTPEITHSPLTPQGEPEEESVDEPKPKFPEPTPTPLASLKDQTGSVGNEPTDQGYDQYSAAPSATITNERRTRPPLVVQKSLPTPLITATDIQQLQLSMGSLPSYRFKSGPEGIEPDFIEHIRQWLVEIRKKEVPVSDAQTYITKREPGAQLQIEWPTVLLKAAEWQERSRIIAQAASYKQQQPDAPNFPMTSRQQHEKWVEEYLASGEEVFKAQHPWYREWFRHLDSCIPALLKKLGIEFDDSTYP